MAESKEELKSLLMKVKEKSEKVGYSTFKKWRSWHLVPSLHDKWKKKKVEAWQIFIFMHFKITADDDYSHGTCSLEGKLWPRQHIKKQRHQFANKGSCSQSYGFSSTHVRKWELDHKEGWVTKTWYFWIMVLEKTLESPLDCKEIKQVHPKGNQSWIFIGRTGAEAEAPILRPFYVKSWLMEKAPMLGKRGEGDDRGWDCWMTSPT